jgi:hypothetical protein
MGVGVEAASAAHVQVKPIPHGSLGHYRSCVRFSLVANQAAAGTGPNRLWELRNTSTNIIIPTRMRVIWTQTAAHTAAIRDSLQLFRVTSLTASATTNTVTPTASVKRTSGMAAAPGGAAIRHVTVAGNSAGMTGLTGTKDGGACGIVETWLLAAVPTAGPVPQVVTELLDDVNGTHPFALAQNEGLELENEVLLGAAAGSSIIVDFSWAEVTAY